MLLSTRLYACQDGTIFRRGLVTDTQAYFTLSSYYTAKLRAKIEDFSMYRYVAITVNFLHRILFVYQYIGTIASWYMDSMYYNISFQLSISRECWFYDILFLDAQCGDSLSVVYEVYFNLYENSFSSLLYSILYALKATKNLQLQKCAHTVSIDNLIIRCTKYHWNCL